MGYVHNGRSRLARLCDEAFWLLVVGMAIGFILGDFAEKSLNQSLAISLGSASILFTRPISLIIIAIIVAGIIFPIWSAHRTREHDDRRLTERQQLLRQTTKERIKDRF